MNKNIFFCSLWRPITQNLKYDFFNPLRRWPLLRGGGEVYHVFLFDRAHMFNGVWIELGAFMGEPGRYLLLSWCVSKEVVNFFF